MLQLGILARDVVTGFEGVITGYCQYLTGCNQYCLHPKAKDGEYKDARWFDESCIIVVNDEPIQINKELSKGGPQAHTPIAK